MSDCLRGTKEMSEESPKEDMPDERIPQMVRESGRGECTQQWDFKREECRK